MRQIAVRASQSDQAPVQRRAEATAEYTDMVRRSEPLIARYLGVALPEPIQGIHVVDRRGWLDANIANFGELFTFIEEIYERNASVNTVGTAVASNINKRLMSVQVGVLLGVLARKVLGQYDLSLLAPEPAAGVLYFVEPNIARVQQTLGLNAHDFRLWIALHETTHAYEFEAYPWVREHFNSLLRSLLRPTQRAATIVARWRRIAGVTHPGQLGERPALDGDDPFATTAYDLQRAPGVHVAGGGLFEPHYERDRQGHPAQLRGDRAPHRGT